MRNLFLVLVFLAAPACAQEPVFPGDSWEIAQAGSYGWDLDGLQAVNAFVRDSSNTTGLVVVDRGKMVLAFGDVSELSYVASVRKSILAILYGNAGADLDQTLADLGMYDVEGLSERERSATVRDLISARSGIYHPASNAGDNSADAPARDSQEPGTYYLYNNWDFNAAGYAFEQLTGRDIYDALEADLAVPLGFEDWDRSAQRKSGDLSRSRYPAYHMWISTRDLARIGYLMLNDGNWDGTQVVPAEWVRQVRALVTPRDEMNPARMRSDEFGYGLMWWVWDDPEARAEFAGAYAARGYLGQYIVVLPAIDVVIAHKTKAAYGRPVSWGTFSAIVDRVLDARR